MKGYAGSDSGAAGPDVFPLLGMDDFGNWDCVSPFPKVKKEAEVQEMQTPSSCFQELFRDTTAANKVVGG